MKLLPRKITSWGNFPNTEQRYFSLPVQPSGELFTSLSKETVLAHGLGRSYGDSAFNSQGNVFLTNQYNKIILLDKENALLRCESGVSFAEVLSLIVPQGFFLPVTPGTQYVTVGGAIANDIHGKNHHRDGSFGNHVTSFELVRSDGSSKICSLTENTEWYRATIGGLGLTGFIRWAEFKLKKIVSPMIDMESIRFESLEEFFLLSKESERQFEYVVSWVDCLHSQQPRGILMRGNFSFVPYSKKIKKSAQVSVPFFFPEFVLNHTTIKAFNHWYYHQQKEKSVQKTVPFTSFFYPLDTIGHWNRMYGKNGFFQHQCVMPWENEISPGISQLFTHIYQSQQNSFLGVLKTFGNVPSQGLLSFCRKGVTLALDFPHRGEKTKAALTQLNDLVAEWRGSVYPAKDALMTREQFRVYYPGWERMYPYLDPKFESDFWRRVNSL